MRVGGEYWEFGISRWKLLYKEWINNKILLYCTGNSIQHAVINHNEKEYEEESLRYTAETESLYYTAENQQTL